MFVVGRMEKNTLENGTTEINMVMVSMNCQMDRKWKENGGDEEEFQKLDQQEPEEDM